MVLWGTYWGNWGSDDPQYSQRSTPSLPRLFLLFIASLVFITFPSVPIYRLNTGVKEGYYGQIMGGRCRERRKAGFTPHIRQHSRIDTQPYLMAYDLPPPLQIPGPISSTAGTSLCFLAVSSSGLGALRETLSHFHFHLEHLP